MPRDRYPWWSQYTLVKRLRRLFQKPEVILSPYVRPGMVCAEIGCGMGFFTVPLAEMVGPEGRVYALDVEPKVLEEMVRRAERAGVAERVRVLLCPAEELRIEEPADFALSVWSMHELDDLPLGVARIRDCLKPGAQFLMAEPKWHVSQAQYEETVRAIADGGFVQQGTPAVGVSRAAVFQKAF